MSSQSKRSAPRPPLRDTAPSAPDLRVLPRDLGSLFARRPLIQGESEEEYDDLLSRVTRAVAPADVIEAVWVKDIVDLIWDSQRLRHLKAGLLIGALRQAVILLLQSNRTNLGSRSINAGNGHLKTVSKWLAGDKAADKKIKRRLAERGLTLDSVMAQALADQLDQLERIDRMIASADARRSKVLAEIERRRDAFARRLRTASDTVVDVA